nr:MAG TPA: hypothetical protein [Caudoviricetes sp.]
MQVQFLVFFVNSNGEYIIEPLITLLSHKL